MADDDVRVTLLTNWRGHRYGDTITVPLDEHTAVWLGLGLMVWADEPDPEPTDLFHVKQIDEFGSREKPAMPNGIPWENVDMELSGFTPGEDGVPTLAEIHGDNG